MSDAVAIDTSVDNRFRADFPALDQEINGHPLAFLDSAASAQQPASVIEAVAEYSRHKHANVHRGVHTLSHRATDAYEGARDKLVTFIGARKREEIIFTKGTTEGINLVAQSFVRPTLSPGDEILITQLEHHANIVPWQILCEQTGASLKVAPIDEDGSVIVESLIELMSERTAIVAIGHVSNALGTVNPVKHIVAEAHARDIPVLVDGAQGVPHGKVDVVDLDCDFYAFSGHKMFGPTGVGVLFGKEELLERMPPYQGGGDMILEVRFDKTTYNDLPYKFEAGTPNISGFVGLGAAVDYMQRVTSEVIEAIEGELLQYLSTRLQEIDGVRLIGTAAHKTSVQSFLLDDIHPHDLGTLLDHQGVAIRTGHHCAMPVMQHFAVPGTARASLALYNTRRDIDQLIDALQVAKRMFA